MASAWQCSRSCSGACSPSPILAVPWPLVFGFALLFSNPGWMAAGWMHAKLTLVAGLVGYHLWCWRLVSQFARDYNRHSSRWYRLFNEVPAVFLVAIVLLAVVKPF